MIDKETLLNFKKHPLLKTDANRLLAELKEWQDNKEEPFFRMNYIIGELKTTKNILNYRTTEDRLANLTFLITYIWTALKEHFPEENFLILRYHGRNIKVCTFWLNNHIDMCLPIQQENKILDRFKLYNKLDNSTDYYLSGIMIVFKNEEDMLLTNMTNCFGIWK